MARARGCEGSARWRFQGSRGGHTLAVCLGEATAESFRADLRAPPYALFAASTPPVGLYARRAWLEEDSVSLRRAEKTALRRILGAQRPNGSFGTVATTIDHLYALHLLQRTASHESDRALDWLWETGQPRP